MAPKNRIKKRVRIQSGHEARYIPNRMSMKKDKSKKSRAKGIQRAARSKIRTHMPTVAELVYLYLEKMSNRSVCRNQKTNATYQFRKEHRNKRMRPDKMTCEPLDSDSIPEYMTDIEESNDSEKRKVFEILSLGAMLGYLTPMDKMGTSFQVTEEYDDDEDFMS